MPLPPNSPDLQSLDLFVTVLETGSLSRASVAHHISQPSASARIRHLERVLGIQLLVRSPTGSKPTQAGSLVGDWAHGVLSAVRELSSGVDAVRAETGSRLQVAASYTIAEYLLPHWLAIFHDRYPDTTAGLRVGNSSQVAELVLAQEVDIGFIESPEQPPLLEWREVARDELVLVVHPSHPWARRRRPVSGKELAREPLVVREHGSGTREAFEAALSQIARDTAEPILELGSTAAVKSAVLDGIGPAVLSRLTVEADLQDGHLVTVKMTRINLERRLRAVWDAGTPLSLAASNLLAQIESAR